MFELARLLSLKGETIAVDLCNTVADINSILDNIFYPNRTGDYYHPALKNWPGDFFKENLWIFREAAPIAGSAWVLRFVAKRNRIFFVTARPEEAREVTEAWLKENNYPNAPVFHTTDKATICRQLDVTVAIEDAPHEIVSLRNAGIEVFVKRQVYNRHLNDFPYHQLSWSI